MLRRSIAQGCSEYNITVLIDQKDAVRALRAVHGRFYLANLPLGVGIVGPGLIGKTFMSQIQSQIEVRLNSAFQLQLLSLFADVSQSLSISFQAVGQGGGCD